MERISQLKTPSNSLALVEIPRHRLDAEHLGNRLTLALDEVQNPGNLGTIIRLADWFGIGDIVCSEGSADCFNPKVVQATMGAILRVRIHYAPLTPLLAGAAARGVAVYGTFLDGEDIYSADLTPGGIVVMGNEGRGVTDAVAGRSPEGSSSPRIQPEGRAPNRSMSPWRRASSARSSAGERSADRPPHRARDPHIGNAEAPETGVSALFSRNSPRKLFAHSEYFVLL